MKSLLGHNAAFSESVSLRSVYSYVLHMLVSAGDNCSHALTCSQCSKHSQKKGRAAFILFFITWHGHQTSSQAIGKWSRTSRAAVAVSHSLGKTTTDYLNA